MIGNINHAHYFIQTASGFVGMTPSIREAMRHPMSRNGIWVLRGSSKGLQKKKLSEGRALAIAAYERRMDAGTRSAAAAKRSRAKKRGRKGKRRR